MARVESTEIAADILSALTAASTGRGAEPGFLTGYQILNRLPAGLQLRLRDEYGTSGKDVGSNFSPANRVAQVASELPDVEKRYLDTRGLQFTVPDNGEVDAGFELCAIFRVVRKI